MSAHIPQNDSNVEAALRAADPWRNAVAHACESVGIECPSDPHHAVAELLIAWERRPLVARAAPEQTTFTASIYGSAAAAELAEADYVEKRAREFLDAEDAIRDKRIVERDAAQRAIVAALRSVEQPIVSALEVFRIAGGDTECTPNPSANEAMECLRDLRACYDEALSEKPSAPEPALDEAAAHRMNDALCEFAQRWRLDGDYLRCVECGRPQLAGYAALDFPHVAGCSAAGCAEPKPWHSFVELLAPLYAAPPAPRSDDAPRKRGVSEQMDIVLDLVHASNVDHYTDEQASFLRSIAERVERLAVTTVHEAAERIVLTSGQIAQLAEFAGRDNEPFEDQAMLIVERCADGHSGPGIYAHYDELPEEGAIHLDGEWPELREPDSARPKHGDSWERTHASPSPSPNCDALLLIAQSVTAALARAGLTDCDDPGEAIDVIREQYEKRMDDDSRDAARYRWLRVDPVGRHTLNGGIPWCARVVAEHGIPTMRATFGDVLDAAIDAQRLAGEGA